MSWGSLCNSMIIMVQLMLSSTERHKHLVLGISFFVLSDIVFTHYAHHLPWRRVLKSCPSMRLVENIISIRYAPLTICRFILSGCSLVGMLQQIWFSICFLPWTYFSFYQYTGLCTTSGWGANLRCAKASFYVLTAGIGDQTSEFCEDLSTSWVAKFWSLCQKYCT